MMYMLIQIFIIFMISMLMLMISIFISKKVTKDREKLSPFECGFDPFSTPRIPFSIQFFFIAVIFLIFDIEITLLIPMILIMNKTKLFDFILISWLIISILLLGLYHEWKQGSLNWTL